MMNQFVTKPIDSQKLLFPIETEFNKDEISSWNGAQNLLNQLGFQFKIEKNTIIFEQLPACLDENEARYCISDITKVLLEDDADKGELAHEIVVKVIKNTQVKVFNLKQMRKSKILLKFYSLIVIIPFARMVNL